MGRFLVGTTLMLILWLICHTSSARIESYFFNSLDIKDGLSQGAVNDIIRDSRGYLWVATDNGLNKYNGYEFQTFYNKHDDTTSIAGNNIRSLYEDKKNRLWIGFENEGLAGYDRKTGNFFHFPFPGNKDHLNIAYCIEEDQQSNIWIGSSYGRFFKFNPNDSSYQEFDMLEEEELSNNSKRDFRIENIAKDDNGYLWLSISYKGLIKFCPDKKEIIKTFRESDNLTNRHNIFDNIQTLSVDQKKNLWIGTETELLRKDIKTGDITEYEVFDSLHVFARSINPQQDETGNQTIWVGTMSNGLGYFDPDNGKITFYKSKPSNNASISLNTINKVYKDPSGIFWLGTNGKGINWFSKIKKFKSYKNLPSMKHNDLNNSIRAFLEDTEGDIWVGSYSGLDKFNPETNEVIGFPYKRDETDFPYNPNVYSLYEDNDQRLWMGTEGGGLYEVDKETQQITPAGSMPNALIYSINECQNGDLWLGTIAGLVKFDTESEEHTTFLDNLHNKRIQTINYIEKDQNGKFWLATNGGLIFFNPDTKDYHIFDEVTLDSTGLLVPKINSVKECNDGNIWLATYGGGLSVIKNGPKYFAGESESLLFEHINSSDGLPDDVIYGILSDDEGFFWLSSNLGIIKLNPGSKKFNNFRDIDGLQSNEFNAGAFSKTRDGQMFFGGINGITSFYPENIKQNTFIPPVVLTEFAVLGENYINDHPLSTLNKIELNHDQNVIDFAFAALDFFDPPNNQYAYKLDGFNEEWVYQGNQRRVKFTNLDPGHYTLHVKASNNDNVWNEEGISIDLIIVPPFWMTNWFYGLVFVLIAGIVGFIIYKRYKANKATQKKLQHLVKKRTEELENTRLKAEAGAKAKSDFLATMSHEIRTPMNAIIGMSELLAQTPLNYEQKDYLNTIRRSGNNLMNIINDILVLSKIQSGKMELENKNINIETELENITDQVSALAADKEIDLACYVDSNIPQAIVGDKTRIGQVLTNLLSNAVKFTDKGFVYLKATHLQNENQTSDKVKIRFSVEDTGIGMNKKELSKIFQDFTQVDASTTRKYGGTGLGLTISQKLINMMGGNIHVESTKYKGSTFYFDLTFNLPSDHKLLHEENTTNFSNLNAYLPQIDNVSIKTLENYFLRFGGNCHYYDPDKEPAFYQENEINVLIIDDNHEKNSKLNPGNTDFVIIHTGYKFTGNENSHFLKKPVKKQQLVHLIDNIINPQTKTEYYSIEESVCDANTASKYPLSILLAEDNLINQSLIKKQLGSMGYDVKIANNGEEAIEKVQSAHFDLIFMDIQMPMIDGIEATKTIRKMPGGDEYIILALTANALEEDREKYLNCGMNDCLHKPVRSETFQEALIKWYKKVGRET